MAIDVNGKSNKRKGAQGARSGAEGVQGAANPETDVLTDEGARGIQSQALNGWERRDVDTNGVLTRDNPNGRTDVATTRSDVPTPHRDVATYPQPERNSISHTSNNTVPKTVYVGSEKKSYLEADPNVAKQVSQGNENFSESQRGSRAVADGQKVGQGRKNSIREFISSLGIQVPVSTVKVAERGTNGLQTKSTDTGKDSKTFQESQNGGRVASAKNRLRQWRNGGQSGEQPDVFNGWQSGADGSVVENGTKSTGAVRDSFGGVSVADLKGKGRPLNSKNLTSRNRKETYKSNISTDISGSSDLKGKEDKKEIYKERNGENGKGNSGSDGNVSVGGDKVGDNTTTTPTEAEAKTGDVKADEVVDDFKGTPEGERVKAQDVQLTDYAKRIADQDKTIADLLANPPKLKPITTLADAVRKVQQEQGESPEQIEAAAKRRAKSDKVKSLIAALSDVVAHSANLFFTSKGSLNTKMGSLYKGVAERIEKTKSADTAKVKASLKELADASAKDEALAQKIYLQELAQHGRSLRDARSQRSMLEREAQRAKDSAERANLKAQREKESQEQKHKDKMSEIQASGDQRIRATKYSAGQTRSNIKYRYDLADRNNANAASRKAAGKSGKGSSRPKK